MAWPARKLSDSARKREAEWPKQTPRFRAARPHRHNAAIVDCHTIRLRRHPAREPRVRFFPLHSCSLTPFTSSFPLRSACALVPGLGGPPVRRPLLDELCVMKSAETHQHLVRMVLVEGSTVAAASRSLGLSVRSAARYMRYFRDTGGDSHFAPEQWNRHNDHASDDPWLRAAVLTAVNEQPEIFLDEMADAVNYIAEEVRAGVEVSAATVGWILARNGFTRKVIERAFLTRNEAQRALWVEAQWDIPLRCRVYVDEAHRVGQAAERRWAWSLRGARAECYVEPNPSVRTSFFVAMANDRVLDWMVTRPPPAQTSVDFLIFVTNFLLPHMQSVEEGRAWGEQPDRCVRVLDNARIHDEVALTTLRDAGVFVLSLSPYSPDFNPIEDVFSAGSSWLRRWSSPAQFNAWPMLTIDTMLLHVTGAMCRGLVRAAVRRYKLYVP